MIGVSSRLIKPYLVSTTLLKDIVSMILRTRFLITMFLKTVF